MTAAKAVLEKELHNMLMQLHSTQLQLQASKGVEVDSESIKKKLVINTIYLVDRAIQLVPHVNDILLSYKYT